MAEDNQDLFSSDASQVARENPAEILSLFLAQSDDPSPPHVQLGFETQREAFEAVGKLFDKNWHTVKLNRDAFDRHTGSGRLGWEGELRPALAKVFETYSGFSRNDLLELCLAILADAKANKGASEIMDILELFTRVEADSENTETSLPLNGAYVEFSNTGVRSDGWFVMTIEQISDCLKDIADNIEEFDGINRRHDGYQEKAWREIFGNKLTNRVAQTMGQVQTLPLFELLAKVIHFSNTDGPRGYKTISTDEQWVRTALQVISTSSLPRQDIPLDVAGDGQRETGGENILFYGAPGTGKSHDVWKMVGSSPWFATVFHPDMQNSDFSGTLKPGVDKDGKVTYAFRPGPFAEALARAWKNPAEKVYLVIEELNRAVAAAVFGELFQLLDREPDGSGQYKVGFPSPEYADWFAAETGLALNKLSLPSNLWILATMNSADQGVYPLDTAFRRRWRQQYLPIDYNKAPDCEVKFVKPAGVASTKWKTFAKALNDFLVSKLEVGEDRLVGPRFLSEHDLDDGKIPGKLLIYLWDDLLRHHGRIDLFDESIRTYGVLDERANSGKQIFSDEFLVTIGSGSADPAETGDEVEA